MPQKAYSGNPLLQEVLQDYTRFNLQPFGHPQQDEWILWGQTMQLLGRLVEVVKPSRIIEFGSGRSTLVLAALLQRYGGRILSFDHHARFARRTATWLKEQGLASVAQVAHRRLVLRRYGARFLLIYAIQWDEFEEFRGCEVALVDGPPGYLGREATLYELFPRLAPGGWVVVDDIQRASERRSVESWRRVFSDALEINIFSSIGEGVGVLRKRAESGPHYPSAMEELKGIWRRFSRQAAT